MDQTSQPAPAESAAVQERTRVNTVVIGGGQAGLTVGYHLKQAGIDFVILDASKRVGDAWRNRWDSLRLFTSARMNGLPGMDFPAPGSSTVGKDDLADFLEHYAQAMDLPVRSRVRVDRLSRDGNDFLIDTARETFVANNVIVAMADYQQPKVPNFASGLDPTVVQIHAAHYKNPSQLQDGAVLVVGMGNSGADIAYELAATHPTTISGTESGSVPFAIESWFGRNIGSKLVRFVTVRVLNTSTPIGRKARPKMLKKSAPLVRIRPKDLARVGVQRVPRITGVHLGKPTTEDGTVLDVPNVIWCTGYKPGFEWIALPVFDDERHPKHNRGVVSTEPGLYFLGLFFLHALWSETITGVQIDARYIVDHIKKLQAPPASA